MVDFLIMSTKVTKGGKAEISPKFIIKKSSDLMIRGGDFYAIWLEDKGMWSTNEQDAIDIIDQTLAQEKIKQEEKFGADNVSCKYLWDSDSGMINHWHLYCQRQMRDNYHMLDEKLIFSNDNPTKKDYASKKLDYPLEDIDIPNYDHLMSVLYTEEERHKIEWAIGSVVTGDSKKIQKFMVLYGAAGTGKSTVLDIIQKLFEGYYSTFDSKALGSSNASFALEAFKTNPLVAIQHDGDLSHIEDNTRLNSLVSHELMTVNEKFKATYSSKFKCFLFMGTNKPVRITDSKSGLLRRLIDVTPSGKRLPIGEYKRITKAIDFELGGIAAHCRDVYLEDPGRYDDYKPTDMMETTNDFFNYMLENYFIFKEQDGAEMKVAWNDYKMYCEEARVPYPLSQRTFKEELKNYFDYYDDEFISESGEKFRRYYHGFRTDKFEKNLPKSKDRKDEEPKSDWLIFKDQPSYFDNECAKCQAQYAKEDETPSYKWDKIRTKLKDINTNTLHYVKVPENHIVIDFDIPDKSGKKNFEKNFKEAVKWPKTYAELSKSGEGIHLHYIYTGDPTKLSRIYNDKIEIKVFTGNSSLRRKLTKCNDIPIASISSGLPLREEKKVVNAEAIKNDRDLRNVILNLLQKKCSMPYTKVCINLIHKDLEDAYKSGMKYDLSDMRSDILQFAAGSTHNAPYCVDLVGKMHFKSDEPSDNVENENAPLVFFDCEVFQNLFLINWMYDNDDATVMRMINPEPDDVRKLFDFRLVGYNCRRYDNHILWARSQGYSLSALYDLSQRIINDKSNKNLFSEAYNISYTDIYDYCATKQSLKKWEIELKIKHVELGLPWDQPVPEDQWETVAAYCDNDVISTRAVWHATQGDFAARQIQVELVKRLHGITNVCVNDTTNTLSKRIIFGMNKTPQGEFNYRNLAVPVSYTKYDEYREKFGPDYEFRIFKDDGTPLYETYDGKSKLPSGYSILPFFPGYVFDSGKSTYLNQEIGEGGRVYAEPGMYSDIWDGDVSSMHPHSIIFESLFGPEYTKRFEDIVKARVAIKHKDFEAAGAMLDGALKPFLKEETAKDLAQALKIVINSIYGLTSAKFANEFKDPRNMDNIVAKRGALFMTLLKREVEKQGYTVAHIKTDSIKIPNATKEIQDFVIKFGKEYGYSFETEAEYARFCLVNDAVYVARDYDGNWTATGTEFQIPYVFKTLFSHEPIEFEDLCELKSVTTALYLEFDEGVPEGQEAPRKFIGKNGVFCPIKPGKGGGLLLREKDGKFSFATGAKGYHWQESNSIETLKDKEDYIDYSYYNKLVDDAVADINQYGDFEQFTSDRKDVKKDNKKIAEANRIGKQLEENAGSEIKSDPLPASFK